MPRFHAIRSLWAGMKPATFRGRLGILLVVSVMTPILLIGYSSFQWMSAVQKTKIDEDLFSSVQLEMEAIERVLANLSDASQMLAFDSPVGLDVLKYMEADTPYERASLFRDITSNLNLIQLSNQSLGEMFYYFPKQDPKHLFELSPVREDLDMESLPLFYPANRIVYYGPHQSVMKGKEHVLVFSLLRAGGIEELDSYVYVETKADNLTHVLASRQLGMSSIHFLINPEGKVVYSEDEKLVPVGQSFPVDKDLEMLQLYESSSRLGWSLVMAVSKAEYEAEAQKWWRQFALISAISLSIGIFSITVIRRMVYSPLRLIGKEMGMFTGQKSDFPRVRTGMEEFDLLLNRFYDMRGTLVDLIEEIERKEKRRGELEVEKLLVQINPHFLHNTLNTVQWLARIHGQPQIDRLVSIFTRVLHYNLGKQSIIVRLREEVEVLHDYIELQNIRYNHSFEVLVDVDPELLDVPIPRFILQPLVENALYHGLPDYNGYISVQIRRMGDRAFQMCVRDNGAGMSPERKHQLLAEEEKEERKSGLGIGLKYIVKLLDVYYKNQATFDIVSEVNKGTTISMVLPLTLEGVPRDDQSNDCG